MRLSEAFGIRDKEVVAFVGGGGKTTTMFRLADELVAQGKRVVTTTTTRIFASQIQLAPQHLRWSEGERGAWSGERGAGIGSDGEIEGWREGEKDIGKQGNRETGSQVDTEIGIEGKIREALNKYPHVLVVGPTTGEGKALGVDPRLIDRLIAMDGVDAVLVEADGSRMRPFKAPAEHEPVIPASTTLLVPIVGIDVLGKTLDDAHVHRATRVASLAGISEGTVLTAEHVASVIGNAEGGLRNKPTHARVIPLINKIETAEQLLNARTIAGLLLKNDEIEAVAIGTVKNLESPISSLEARVAAVILAAGGSTRMRGEVKQLLPWGDTTFVGNAVRVARQARVSQIVVVTGNRAQEVGSKVAAEFAPELRDGADIRIVENTDWASGRASSVRAGIQALNENAAGAIFINADQPFLTPRVIDTILERFAETRAPIVAPSYRGVTGSPVLFAREMFDALIALQGEQGGRDILQKHTDVMSRVEIEDGRAAMDLNTPEDYQQACETLPS